MLCDVGGSLDKRALVAALKAVRGVVGAEVAPDDAGGLGTLRLDLASGADEAVVAEQVGRVLREDFGLGVDADRVELVQPVRQSVEEHVSADRAGGLASRVALRPSIAKMHLLSAGLDVTASVTLLSGERTATGEARGLASQSGVHRAVAVATLRAVEELLHGAARVELEHLEITPMGTERTVVVLLTLLTAHGSEPLTGAAAVRDDVRQAVIRATLDALNRRFELLLAEV